MYIPGTILIPHGPPVTGPDGSGSYRYQLFGLLSQHKYHNAASAAFDARRPQIVTQEGELVPEAHYSPHVN